MARLVRFAPRYLRQAHRLGLRSGTPIARDVGRVISALENEQDLPGPGDVYSFVPDPTRREEAVQLLAHARRVVGRNLWIWYWATDEEVQLVALTNIPPTRA